MYEKFAQWISEHKEFAQAVAKLLLDPDGASFPTTKTAAVDEPTQIFLKYRAEYLDQGREFLVAVAGAEVGREARQELLVASEADAHLFHNAAVLWLEDNPGTVIKNVLDYEECLKALWFDEVLRAGTARAKTMSNREKALRLYCFGADRDTPLPMGDNGLAAARLLSHVSLGKVIARDRTRFHDDGAIRVHPGFWGLFLFSPVNKSHRGNFRVEQDSAEERWLNELPALAIEPKLVHDAPRGQFQVYERVPRPFLDTALTPPGVFLHRSRAHGRDDFLVRVAGTDRGTRKVMVTCTKGVGLQPDCLPRDIAVRVSGVKEFTSAFEKATTTNLPFTYPVAGQNEGDSSWRNMGFCLVRGDDSDEIATVDFAHFRELYEKAAEHRLRDSVGGFVEPFVCVELNCLPHNVERMPEVAAAVEKKGISWPAQVVTVSDRETSLRLTKQGTDQDYDYRAPALELLEWERVYAGSAFPAKLQEVIHKDVEDLISTMTTAIERLIPKEEARSWVDALPAKRALLERRALLAARVISSALASWTVFVENGLASDTYTGSFSGRNFNSGPRDSNEWGPFSRGSVRSDHQAPAGEGKYCGHVDLGNLAETLGMPGSRVFAAVGLTQGTSVPSLRAVEKSDGSDEDFNTLRDLDLLWTESALYRLAIELGQFFRQAKVKLDEIAQTRAKEVWGTDLPIDEQVVVQFRAALESLGKAAAETEGRQPTPVLPLFYDLLPKKV
ncbi:hypothetical protein AMES_5391 [Amycolatopsis mediterranei S699]|uniref:Uncharacterized protein n=2 Tax=Amycolatopsis mediterranei TaxID=33910 RepID=A0A0H3D996_AMYMU|nr:hypothetical protein [Amycolatopsis mediterranei]ADJ47216.1 hypothetical protein AMED_5456 [Amycolatopsis mediterranei U32]AEK44039.1 hypothetical protein RAM_27810 [Amycolatopsis mediterranei S699]AFO78927.1 hypothetical protein AMES_5391 [Amycolatopsis mediterranei S699]AGT86055.1 hypothetical protein B737_5391 [Amycolatopsis mediterranei RB]KDO04763.1 hypothetical protein DV26_42225 [Amycolatopsis mediterranei]